MSSTPNEPFLGSERVPGQMAEGTGRSPDGPSTAGDAKDSVADAAQQIASTAKQESGRVVEDVQDQTRRLAGQTREAVNQQVLSQRDRAVQGLRSLVDELQKMSQQGEQPGAGAEWVRRGAGLAQQAADFLDQREPAQLTDEVRRVARRHPGKFLLASAATGAVMGRLSRSMMSTRNDTADAERSPAPDRSDLPMTGAQGPGSTAAPFPDPPIETSEPRLPSDQVR